MPSEKNKKIAKNTLMLYFRMLLIMAVSLYTVRVVLRTLGVVDYGIYNVVGGIVIMFSFLSSTMTTATQRFFAFELGRNDFIQLKRTFSLSVISYAVISIIILLLAETFGLWFLNTKLVIPIERIGAANWIYQLSIFSFIVTILTVPYDAAIIAHENMNIYAYVSIVEALMRLIIVFVLLFFSFDKLKLYACLTFATTCVITFIYRTICKRKYEECHFKFYWNKELFKTIIGFSGWNLFGTIAWIMNNQGINILLNMFFGPAINAARAIAYQVNTAVNQFVTNYSTAFRPQITKYYAANEQIQMMNLIFQSSKFSFFLLLVLSMPVLLETNFILTLWLKSVPEYVVLFSRLVIISALVNSLSNPLITAALATGKIKQYQLVVGSVLLLNLPISYLLLKIGFPPQSTMYMAIIFMILLLGINLWMLKKMIKLSIYDYSKKVLLIVIVVCLAAYILPLFLMYLQKESFIRFLIVGSTGLITSLVTIYFLGLSVSEQLFFRQIIRNIITKKII
jgi:O-antigen/teichoic acid export membrane protein